MTLRNKILLTIGTLIITTTLIIIYVAGTAIYRSNAAHAYSVLSINNETFYMDIRGKMNQIRNYSITSLYNKLNGFNVTSPTEDDRLKTINSITIKDTLGNELINFPSKVKTPCNEQIINSDTVVFSRSSINDYSFCISYLIYNDSKSYTATVNVSMNFFNRKILTSPVILSVPGVLDIDLAPNKTIPMYVSDKVKNIIGNIDVNKEKGSFIKTDKYFVLLQDAPKTNIKMISYNGLKAIRSSFNQFILSAIGTMLLVLGLAIFVFYVMVNSFLRPIKDLCTASKCFAEGQYEHKIAGTNFQEINELISSFNIMISKIKDREKELQLLNETLEKEVVKKSNELVHAAKMASLGTLSSGIAHEFNNILGAVIGHVSLALEKKNKKEMESALEVSLMASERACGIVSRLQDFAKNKGQAFSRISINNAINNVVKLIQKDFINNNIKIKSSLTQDIFVNGDQTQIEQVLLNLLINSRQAMPKGGTIEINSKTDKKNVRILVKDSGTGIKEEIRERIFEPFFTTKGVLGINEDYGIQNIEGTGLGLSVSHGIITNHSGSIKLLESSSKGTTFEIKIPLA